ncbi:MAG TPA: hypothetical protein VGI10_12580 [Polyangiaceae bacterium]
MKKRGISQKAAGPDDTHKTPSLPLDSQVVAPGLPPANGRAGEAFVHGQYSQRREPTPEEIERSNREFLAGLAGGVAVQREQVLQTLVEQLGAALATARILVRLDERGEPARDILAALAHATSIWGESDALKDIAAKAKTYNNKHRLNRDPTAEPGRVHIDDSHSGYQTEAGDAFLEFCTQVIATDPLVSQRALAEILVRRAIMVPGILAPELENTPEQEVVDLAVEALDAREPRALFDAITELGAKKRRRLGRRFDMKEQRSREPSDDP